MIAVLMLATLVLFPCAYGWVYACYRADCRRPRHERRYTVWQRWWQ